MPRRRYKVVVMIGSGGGGHMATGRALRDACNAAKLPFDFQMLDVSEILGLSVTLGDGVYNWLMSSGRARWIPTWHNFGKVLSSMNERSLTEAFRVYLAKLEFDMLISCIPFVNNHIAESISTFKPARPMVTLLSDFENTSDHPWMQDHRQILICGTQNAIRQAEALGHPTNCIYGTSGMIVHPSFYEVPFKDRSEERIKLGLHPEWRTVCVLFGGFAPVFLPQVVQILFGIDEPLNLILMCGKNKDAIQDSLKPFLQPAYVRPSGPASDAAAVTTANGTPADPAPNGAAHADGSTAPTDPGTTTNGMHDDAAAPTDANGSTASLSQPTATDAMTYPHAPHAPNGKEQHNYVALIGFTDQVAYYMRLSDVLVGKPGPGVVSEALVSGLPVIVELNEEHTPPQEQAVARWINEHSVGVVIESFQDLPYAITQERMAACKINVDKIKNNAVFEVPHILAGVMKDTERRHKRILSATSPQDMHIMIAQAPATQQSGGSTTPTGHSPLLSAPGSLITTTLNDQADGSRDRTESINSGSSTNAVINMRADDGSSDNNSGVVTTEPSTVTTVTVVQRIDSLSVNSPSYSDAINDFQEPLRLDEEHVPEFRMLINASGRWGHDVIKFGVSKFHDPESFEITLSSGYYVTWVKELVIVSGSKEKARLVTKNEDHGPKTVVFRRDEFPGGTLRLNFAKAGFLGVKTHSYTRYLDVHWCCGRVIHFIWTREKFSSNQRDG
eukprot:Unigene3858_Nuclearia_a/m.11761 Unigene3858_Nuclearia_a/g.11761  ORF Unigene3858_Nuclearia_a/g.11761 Unigene3858_Nuclearia_a/m.11761 type:complete len:730 (-) Unigene3858_Nuclearia_a:54-2243(-)